jgi:hypothetical protein
MLGFLFSMESLALSLGCDRNQLELAVAQSHPAEPAKTALLCFVHALEPVPALADFVVEMVSNAFGRLPDPVLLPWLPALIGTLRSASELAPLLIREAGRIFPGRLLALDPWIPPWRAQPEAVSSAPGPADTALVGRYRDTAVALEALLRHTNPIGP